ncbi:hypothetical protein [Pedobacter sp. GR22-6]|uniref:hypothetical protein n=1 Tax=Pedobacter sp. GR22-6 TaxID=3127957 RepID=UPI00307DB189
MNENNFEYLKKLLDNLGFGKHLNLVLQQALEKDFNTFSLGMSSAYLSDEAKILGSQNRDIVKYQLNFNKSKSSDSVFLNDYRVSLYKPMEVTPRTHTFDLERDHRITAWQAYRLLSGFAIEKNVLPQRKEGVEVPQEARKIWMKLSLDVLDAYDQHPMRRFYPEYGYDLGAALDKYPFTNLASDSIREMALQDLSKGKLFKADMRLYDQIFPVYIAARPESRSLDVYDKGLNAIPDWQIFPDKVERQSKPASGQVVERDEGNLSAQQEQPWEQDPAEEAKQKLGR